MNDLLVDMGNTAVKWCLAQPKGQRLGVVHSMPWGSGASSTTAVARSMAREMAQQIRSDSSAASTERDARKRELIYCSVASAERTQALVEAVCKTLQCQARPFFSQAKVTLSPGALPAYSRERCELLNSYKRPRQLGSDRWAALLGLVASPALWRGLIAADGQADGQAVLVSAGTATVMDWLGIDSVSSQGTTRFCFQGGTIRPGYGLMASALGQSAAGLGPESPAVTRRAMQAGIAQAEVSGVFSRGQPGLVVVHGGFARQWLKDFRHASGATGQSALDGQTGGAFVVHAPGLVLQGLRAWRQTQL